MSSMNSLYFPVLTTLATELILCSHLFHLVNLILQSQTSKKALENFHKMRIPGPILDQLKISGMRWWFGGGICVAVFFHKFWE